MSGRAIALVPGSVPYPGYLLLKPIGSGGWGEVWKASQPDGSDCALKFIPCDPGLAPAKEVRALQALRHIRHPHLLQTRNVWSVAGFIVVVMDLCDGSLLDLLDVYLRELQTPMSGSHVCYFLRQAAQAIDFLNARRHDINEQRMAIRHCDVKPSNLLVVGETIKVADYSLAVPTTATMGLARRAGTPRYCAPEVFQGSLSDRTDQYALAITYYQLRTGLFPFNDTPDRIEPTYVPPEPDLAQLPRSERLIIQRALAPVPQDRWGSCVEMLQRLSVVCKSSSQPMLA